jgi:TRAP-type C4-dicarboxylate transport system permease small subunit
MKLYKIMQIIVSVINKVVKASVIVATIVTIIVIAANVFSRNLFKYPMSWPDELGRYLYIMIVYYAYVLAIIQDKEIRINIIDMKFSKHLKQISLARYIYGFFFSIGIVVLGLRYALLKYVLGDTTVIFQWPEWLLIIIFLVVGGMLMGLNYIYRMLTILRKNQEA